MGEDVTIRAQNLTNVNLPLARNVDQQQHMGLATVLGVSAIYATINIICICLVAMCLMWVALKYLRSREERNKIGEIIAHRFWKEENQIACLFQVLLKMKEAVVFRDITSYHILSYKYRTDNGVYSLEQMDGENGTGHYDQAKTLLGKSSKKVNVFVILKKIERLFFSLTLQLPRSKRCSKQVASTVGSAILSIAQVTSLVWCDEKAETIFRVVRFFSGPGAAHELERNHMKDNDLETLVLSRVPYVTNLLLGPDFYFILRDTLPEAAALSGDLVVASVLKKISQIDHFFCGSHNKLDTVREKVVAIYQEARELSFKNKLILSRAYYPDLSTIRNGGLAGRFLECITCLVHLLRLMSYGSNARKMDADQDFKPFLENLTKLVAELKLDVSDDMSTIERACSNIVSCLNGLTSEHILADREFTKAKLELIEKDLKSHVKYLTSKKVEKRKDVLTTIEVGIFPPEATEEGTSQSRFDESQPGSSGMKDLRKSRETLPLMTLEEKSQSRDEYLSIDMTGGDDSIDEDPYCETHV